MITRAQQYWDEMFNERAAIMEYDGGKTRQQAEACARAYVDQQKLRLQREGNQ